MNKGTYCLLLELESDEKVEVGSLGDVKLEKGFYCYVGSAFGPGGFKRLGRHKKLSQTGEGNLHWHMDYVSELDSSQVTGVFKVPEEKIECEVAQNLGGEPVEDFGCSDCDCGSHFFHYKKEEGMLEDVEKAVDEVSRRYVKEF